MNLSKFREASQRRLIDYNEQKCIFSTRQLSILGYIVEDGEIRPDPERLKPLQELPVPHDVKSLRRAMGLFAYYARWIYNYSGKVQPLSATTVFPLSEEAKAAFCQLKCDIESAAVQAIDELIPFEIETDASDSALAAVLTQDGRPVAFYSRSLQGSERRHAAVEKEAQAIVEAVRHWRHYLSGRHFTIKTDQRSVSYVFNKKHKNKIKNDKMLRWKLELACYDFDIVYRPGKENFSSDALSRSHCGMASRDLRSLSELHDALCHPGITRLFHFVRSKNLPYTLEEVRQTTASCKACAECKPRFHYPEKARLIKATQPFERLSIDFKGPLPSTDKNKYFLNIVDEYSRFPFVFQCSDMTSSTIINCLCQLFSVFGMPAYIHSDRGTSFMSKELQDFLASKGIAYSRTTSYNPHGNGQVERYNGVIWKAIATTLRSRGLPDKCWQMVLPDALHAVRSLLCTATNATPHERLFNYARRSSVGDTIPSWLCHPGPVLLKRHVRASKTDALVDEVELLHANPQYAHIRYPNGKEDTVSIRHLAPSGSEEVNIGNDRQTLEDDPHHVDVTDVSDRAPQSSPPGDSHTSETVHGPSRSSQVQDEPPALRRSSRVRRPPTRYEAF